MPSSLPWWRRGWLLTHPSRGAIRHPRSARLRSADLLLGSARLHLAWSAYALSETAALPKWIPPGQLFWAVATGVAHLLAGIAILSGVLAVPASRLLTLMLVIFGALVWGPSLFANPRVHMVWAGNAINLALIGAAWVVADSIARGQKKVRGEPDATS